MFYRTIIELNKTLGPLVKKVCVKVKEIVEVTGLVGFPVFNQLSLYAIRNGRDFKTCFTVMNYGHGDIQLLTKFVTYCFSLQPG